MFAIDKNTLCQRLKNLKNELEKEQPDLLFITTYHDRLEVTLYDMRDKIDTINKIYYTSLVWMILFLFSLPFLGPPPAIERRMLEVLPLAFILSAIKVIWFVFVIGGTISTLLWIFLVVRFARSDGSPFIPEWSNLKPVSVLLDMFLGELNHLVFDTETRTKLKDQIKLICAVLGQPG